MAVKTVVIVEDDPDTAAMLAEMMRLIGYRVFQSAGGLAAIDLIAEKTPTMVLMDQMMPEFSGLDVLKSMRLDAKLRSIPVIIISAWSLPKDLRRVLEAGAASFIQKPVGFPELKKAVETLVPPEPYPDKPVKQD